jgi:hypothetical protein
MYVHLINWKWEHITTERGTYRDHEYDAILPDRYVDQFPMLYSKIVEAVRSHRQRFPFRLHKHFNHVASSQAANINLFLPILLHPDIDAILGAINPQFARLATHCLDRGWRIEFWDEPFKALGDKTESSGTDADMAVAYYSHDGQLCLWLIEHKLTEAEFTTCGGFASKARKPFHDCTRNFSEILKDKNTCYYHDVREFKYWDITADNVDLFVNHAKHTQCPFQGGMNQLWRNQLLAMAVEEHDRQPYTYASFSVVKHPANPHLDNTLASYKDLIGGNPKFSTFTSEDVLRAAEALRDSALDEWAEWYRCLYRLHHRQVSGC